MQTQEAIEDKAKSAAEEKKAFLQEIIVASARYERLLAVKDFNDILNDLENVVKLHEEEIKGYLAAYSLSTSFFKKMRLVEVMGQHQLRKEQITEAINYPRLMVEKASIAREQLAAIKAQEAKEN